MHPSIRLVAMPEETNFAPLGVLGELRLIGGVGGRCNVGGSFFRARNGRATLQGLTEKDAQPEFWSAFPLFSAVYAATRIG